jgi:hydroxymethylglutaryl-CoA lyase
MGAVSSAALSRPGGHKGLGGSPIAPGAAGNVATEEAVALLDDLGYLTGIDVERVIESALLAEQIIGHAVPSRVAHAGPRGLIATP